MRSPWGATEYKSPSSLEIRKKIWKNYKIPHSRFCPKNTKKIPKNYENGQKMTSFVIFQYFFRIFGAEPGMGDFVIFSYFFSYFQAWGVFVFCSTPGRSQNLTKLTETSQISLVARCVRTPEDGPPKHCIRSQHLLFLFYRCWHRSPACCSRCSADWPSIPLVLSFSSWEAHTEIDIYTYIYIYIYVHACL